jgi:hypothetical protein
MIICLLSCNNKKSEQKNTTIESSTVNWNLIEMTKLPFEIRIKDKDSINTFKSFYSYYGFKQEHEELNYLFSGLTEIKNEPWHINAHNAPNMFLKRLPDVNGNKVLLFAVCENKSDILDFESRAVWVELQVCNINNKIVDKMILYMFMPNECTFARDFICCKNNTIEVKDRLICVDIYAEKKEDEIASDTTILHLYKINEKGIIVEIGRL